MFADFFYDSLHFGGIIFHTFPILTDLTVDVFHRLVSLSHLGIKFRFRRIYLADILLEFFLLAFEFCLVVFKFNLFLLQGCLVLFYFLHLLCKFVKGLVILTGYRFNHFASCENRTDVRTCEKNLKVARLTRNIHGSQTLTVFVEYLVVLRLFSGDFVLNTLHLRFGFVHLSFYIADAFFKVALL